MDIKLKLIFLLFGLTIISCETIDKNFEVIQDKMEIGYFGDNKDSIVIAFHGERGVMLRLVPPIVKRIGHNEKYLIVERQKSIAEDSTMIKYYIINMELFENPNSESDEKIMFGPLDFPDFVKTKQQLGIESLDFDKNY